MLFNIFIFSLENTLLSIITFANKEASTYSQDNKNEKENENEKKKPIEI